MIQETQTKKEDKGPTQRGDKQGPQDPNQPPGSTNPDSIPGAINNFSFMTTNQQWLNQIQMYNILKFKNQGFKFWVEYATVWGNNFCVVKSVVKRRNWLTWVDYDPYDESAHDFMNVPPRVEKPKPIKPPVELPKTPAK